jgi:isoamylase
VNDLRARQRRNILATLLLSQGVPMLLGGDEIGRTQGGNNNAYCQDNEISWFDWENADQVMLAYTRWLIGFRRDHPVFRRRDFFAGRPIQGVPDIGWFAPDGSEMSQEDWDKGFAKSLGVFLNGDAIPGVDHHGEPVRDDSFVVLFNAHYEPLEFVVPGRFGREWAVVLDTADPMPPSIDPLPDSRLVDADDSLKAEARSLVLLRRLA